MAIRVYIRKRPDRKNLVLFYDDPDTGKEVSRSARTADRGEAERAARDWENELLAFRGSKNDGWKWFTTRFMDEPAGKLSKASRTAYRSAFTKFEKAMRPQTVSEVTTDTVSLFASKLPGSPATVAKHLRHLKAAFRWATQIGMIAKPPHFQMPKQGKRKFMRGRPITEAEYKKMLKHAGAATGEGQTSRWRRLLRLLWLSGLRIEEATVLAWDSPPLLIDLDAKPYPQMLIYGEGQKSRNDEAVPLAPDFVEWLRTAPENARRGKIAPLFGGTGKRLVSRANISKAVARIGKAAKIVVRQEDGKERFAAAHDLRRAFGTRWALKVPPLVLQKMMRHAHLSTTMRYYVHLDSSQIGDVLWKGVPPESPPRASKKRGRQSEGDAEN